MSLESQELLMQDPPAFPAGYIELTMSCQENNYLFQNTFFLCRIVHHRNKRRKKHNDNLEQCIQCSFQNLVFNSITTVTVNILGKKH